MLSRRLPHDHTPNPLARLLAERRAAGARLLDLTESNPTRVGLTGADARALAALLDPAAAVYEPDPRGARAAREAIAGCYAARGSHVSPAHLVLTASTSEAYAHLFRLLADPGDVVLTPAPSYPLFEPLAALEGVRLSPYRLAYDGAWHLDLDSLERAVEPRARAAVVVQPNNPTGSCLAPDELAALEALCERQGMAIVSDEVFVDSPRPPAAAPLPSLLGERRVPTFVLGGLSKTCGMPQLKLAWIAACGPAPARDRALAGLEWIADLFLSVSTPVQAALPRLLEARHAFQSRVGQRIADNLACVADLTGRLPALTVLRADGGWTQVLRLPRTRGDQEWAMELLRRDVVVYPGHFYDFAEDGHLVVSLLPEPAVFAEGMRRLEECVAGS